MRRTLAVVIFLGALAGCLDADPGGNDPAATSSDAPAVRPTRYYEGFHRIGDVDGFVDALVANASDVVTPFEVGSSVNGNVQQGLRITAPGDAAGRVRFLIDGGIHGNEVYGSESVLYIAAWLTENHATNQTARDILSAVDLRLIFHINPDGREDNTRENAHSVDLNRNFDVDFGNPSPLCRSQSISPLIPYYYAGPEPTSEPETKALADYMEGFEPEMYLSFHTGRHALIRPWAACNPPHPMPAADDAFFEAIEAWTRAHTTYQNTGTAEETADRTFPPGAASGSSTDWCYLTYHCVALTMEVTLTYGEGNVDPAEQAEEAFPIVLHLLENAKSYRLWENPPDDLEAYGSGYHLLPVPEAVKNGNPI
jgi:hypothetical protein